MGSRAVAVVCRDAGVADAQWQDAVIGRLREAITAAGLWDELDTDWIALDTELLPWSAKAGELLRTKYAAVGAAARTMTAPAAALLGAAQRRGIAVDDRLAAASDGFVIATRNRVVALDDAAGCADAVTWWAEMVDAGGEGMVVKPLDSIVTGPRGLVQPGIKCRGPEYLRIIYGPEYRTPANLDRLRDRNLTKKRSLAQREFALGIEALERFVAGEPLHRVHECVFGVLAMESEPVDPRL